MSGKITGSWFRLALPIFLAILVLWFLLAIIHPANAFFPSGSNPTNVASGTNFIALPQYLEMAKLTASDASGDKRFGESVDISGNTLVIGAMFDSEMGTYAGAAYVFDRDPITNVWAQVKKLVASDASVGHSFGRSVSISGNTIIVGADGNSAAYIFERDQGGTDNWGEVTKLTANDGIAGSFGHSVSIHENTVVVGAYGDDDLGNNSGSAYIFDRNQGGVNNWGEVKKITASDAATDYWFGWAVATSYDDILVGAPQFLNGAGAAYIFERNQGGIDNWGEVKKITASDIAYGDLFSWSVALDRDKAILGSRFNDDGGDATGSAYIFEREQGGANNWGEVVKLTASNPSPVDEFGFAVGISGEIAIVGVWLDDDMGYESGSAYVFERNFGGADTWGEVAKLIASDEGSQDAFGYSTAINGDDIVIGALGKNATYVFQRIAPLSNGGPGLITDISPSTISNDVTSTVYITATNLVPAPLIQIGRVTLSSVTQIDTDTVAAQIPHGLTPGNYQTRFYDNVERDNMVFWQPEPQWARTSTSTHTGGYSWSATLTQTISATLTLSETLDLTGVENPVLHFWHSYQLNQDDRAAVEISVDSSTWHPLYSFQDAQGMSSPAPWGHYQLDLTPYSSFSAVRIRYKLDRQNAGGNNVMWYVDDIAVTSALGGLALVDPGDSGVADYWLGDFTITNQASQFGIDISRLEQVADVPFPITIIARDPFGYMARTYTGSVTLTASTGSISPTMASGFVDGQLVLPVQVDSVQDDVTVTATAPNGQGTSVPFDIVDQERAAYLHLEEQLDRWDTFGVYWDGGAYTNHFGISYMGVYTDVFMDAYYTSTIHSGSSAIIASYIPASPGECWGGAAWLDPEGNWNGGPGGFDLRGTTELVFWAKGQQGGEQVSFGMGGIPTGAPARSVKIILSNQWQKYILPLNGMELSRVIEGFYWAASCDDNPNGITIYLDEITYRYRSVNEMFVFQDQFSLENSYTPSGWMGDFYQIQVDEGIPGQSYVDDTSVLITYDSVDGPNDWAGFYWLWPDKNWGTDPNGGRDLTGADRLVFRARGVQGGEIVKFGMGGVTGPYGDTTGKHEILVVLTDNWVEYSIDVSGLDLSRIVGSFSWTASQYWNPNGLGFYIDDVRYEFDYISWPHFVQSYVGDLTQPDDIYFDRSAHLYDNSLALLAFLARGTESDMQNARDIADAMVYAQSHDPAFTDGRLRNVYHAEVLSGSDGLIWYWNDAYGAGSAVGNMSWATLALAQMYEATGESQYLTAALQLGEWIVQETYDSRLYGGYRGGYEGWEGSQERLDWKSTEHNIDAYVAFARLYDLTGDETWWTRALHAKRFVKAMWIDIPDIGGDIPTGWFWLGTKGDFLVYGEWETPVTTTNTCLANPIVALPNNHYYPTTFGPAGNEIQFTDNFTGTVHTGISGLRVEVPASLPDWAGVYWLEGVENWGSQGPGYDMIGARSLTVWMKTNQPGTTAVIGMGGVPFTTTILPISMTLPGTYAPVLTETVSLTTEWHPYTITVPTNHNLDMGNHIGGLFLYFDSASIPNGTEVYLDDLVYHFDNPSGEMLNYYSLVADVNAWGLMSLGERLRYEKTVEWLYHGFVLTETAGTESITGMDFDLDRDHIWFEGTGQDILAFQVAERNVWSTNVLADMVLAQENATRTNRKGIVAALSDCLTTNLGWFYYNRLHIAPTAWYIFASRNYNPYWDISTGAEIPHQGPVILSVEKLADILVLQGQNFYPQTVSIQTPFTSTINLDIVVQTPAVVTATLPVSISLGITNTIWLTNTDGQSDHITLIEPASSAISISGHTPNPSIIGQPVNINFAVTATIGIPTGIVTVTTNSGEYCAGLLANGLGNCDLIFLSVGTKTMTATFPGNQYYLGSISENVSHIVNKAWTNTTITGDTPDPSLVGQAITVTFSVTSPFGTPTGSVTVSDGVDSCIAPVEQGECILVLSTLGVHLLTASYTGDANFLGSISPSIVHTVKASTTSTITTHTPAPSVVGQPVSVTFAVTSTIGIPTGVVTVAASTGESCTGVLTDGQGNCTITLISVGMRTLTALYSGNENYNGSTSTGVVHAVIKADTFITITEHVPDPSDLGQAISVTFSVTSVFGTPTGNVTIGDGVDSCTGSVEQAYCVLILTTPGQRVLTATYSGDANFNGSVSPSVNHIVNNSIFQIYLPIARRE